MSNTFFILVISIWGVFFVFQIAEQKAKEEEENLSEEELTNIKNKIIEMSKKKQENGKTIYKACLNYVSATK